MVEEKYTWKQVHKDLEDENFIGMYGGGNAAFHALAECKSKIDLHKVQKQRSDDEYYIESLKEHLEHKNTQREWEKLVTLDPMGLFSKRPTQAATTSKLNIPELEVERDGKIVNEDGSINVVKCAVDYVWNLPGLSERLGLKEDDLRKSLARYACNKDLLNKDKKTYLAPANGVTVYFIGDISKLKNEETEVAVRVHDSCNGSDVFGTDICTCRPYLVFAVNACVELAQRGGVGVIAYFRKEGRALGEVTKFRVYNARKAQDGGDTAEKYFHQTETIAGVRDARFQRMMPDILLWLGITKIDWLLSMSSEKYDAITSLGIKVMQRIPLPDMFVPNGAEVEISAKISAGYQTNKLNENAVVSGLRDLTSIRSKTGEIFDRVKQDKGIYFTMDLDKVKDTAKFVVDIMKSRFDDFSKIPYHSRWRHFEHKEEDKVAPVIAKWSCSAREKVRRQIDLVTISVLLDAGAGKTWKYVDDDGFAHTRSEGLAMATLDMFLSGLFSSDIATPHRVNSYGLENMKYADYRKGFQVSSANPMTGLKGRFGLLKRLAAAMRKNPEFFGDEVKRPGNILDYVERNSKDGKVSLKVLWKALIQGLEPVWPEQMSKVRRGDVWVYSPLKKIGVIGSDFIPFHKLTQWLTLSILEPLQKYGLVFTDLDLLTGLAEYRNGGLFVDMGVITPRKKSVTGGKVSFDIGSELVVEWRALTVQLIDCLLKEVRILIKDDSFTLMQLLEGGSWLAGRKIAAQKRKDGSSPITIKSDGTVF